MADIEGVATAEPAATAERPPVNGRSHGCPKCGSRVIHGYTPSVTDPDDVDPTGYCTNPRCGWEF